MKCLLQIVKEHLPQGLSNEKNLYLMAIDSEKVLNHLVDNNNILTGEVVGAITAKSLTNQCLDVNFFAALATDSNDVLIESEDEYKLKSAKILGIFSLYRLIREYGEDINLNNANLSGAQLQSADLRGANLENCNLQGANLMKANLKDANLVGANMEGCNLTEANLFAADLTNADLRRANLTQAELRKTTLVGTSLRGAELWSASMWGVDIKQSFHNGVDLSRADTRGS